MNDNNQREGFNNNFQQPQMQPMANNHENIMQQHPEKKSSMLPIIIGVVVVVALAVVLILVFGGQKNLTCTQTDDEGSMTFNFVFKKDTLQGGSVKMIYDTSDFSESDIELLKSMDLCSKLKTSYSFVDKCDSKSMEINATIDGSKSTSTDSSYESTKDWITSQGYTCK